MKLFSSVFAMLRTTYGRLGAAIVLAFSLQPATHAFAQPLSGAKNFLDRIQNGGAGGAGTPTNVQSNPFSQLYNQISGSAGGSGLDGLNLVFNQIIQTGITVVTMIAVIFVIVAGVQMVLHSNSEDQAKKQSTVIFNIIAGIVIMNVANLAIQWVAPDTSSTRVNELLNRFDSIDMIRQSAVGFATLVVFPLLDFALSFLAGIAMLYIVYAGLNIILHRGEEDKIKEARTRIVKTVVGIAVILLNKSLVGVFYGNVATDVTGSAANDLKPDLQQGINLAFNIANYALGFFGLIAVVMLIYAGVLVVSSGGDDKRRQQGMKILRFVVYAIILAMSAYTLTSAIIGITTRPS